MPLSPTLHIPQTPLHQKKDAAAVKSKSANDKQTPMKGADFGKAIGIDRPANVRDKIRKWQTDLNADDAGAENAATTTTKTVDQPAPSPKLQPNPTAEPVEEKSSSKLVQSPSQLVEPLPERPKSAKKPVHNRLDEEVHTATAPKKRVVSDSHWRNRKSPPKDGAGRPSPKPLPSYWVRPAVKKTEPTEPKEPKLSTPTRPDPIPLPILLFASGQRPLNARQRRLSRPTSSGNDDRPGSSGSEDAKGGYDRPPSPEAEAEKVEVVRIRRRRRARTSAQDSLCTEEVSVDVGLVERTDHRSRTHSRGSSAEELRVERTSPLPGMSHDDEFRETRRRSHRVDHSFHELEGTAKESSSTGPRRTSCSSRQIDAEDGSPRSQQPAIPVIAPKVFGTRLEAWLQGTPDPFTDTDTRKRRTSKESVSTHESNRNTERSEATASSATHAVSPEDVGERKSSRRRKRRSRNEAPTMDAEEPSEEAPLARLGGEADARNVPTEDALSSSPTLKRRGARRAPHSPTKDRSTSLPVPSIGEDNESSVLSSSIDGTAMDLAKISIRPPPESIAMRRMFPSRGKRLSTIASVETFTTKLQAAPSSEVADSEVTEAVTEPVQTTGERPVCEPSELYKTETLTTLSRKSTRRSKLASHADLISVLSMPRAGAKSIRSARSIRTNRSRLATATTGDIMNELASDETKYMRELRTLVDGVIPVLLSCVLSKSDSAVAAGLFSSASKKDPSNVTKPIIDMGISLERLKSLHRRVPKEDPDAFLSWTQSAQRIYSDYINVWRLGFQDVVVNLAPADEDPFTAAKVVTAPDDAAPWDEGLPQNAEGYVVNGEGERVDVAYMLKRPLVRLKYLAKSVKGIHHVKPSEKGEQMTIAFQDLVTAARKRSNEERARLEDEAAASIDPTRARDLRTLAPLAGVRIDATQCVRARDYFDMHLYHSSGQEISCRVELLLRDDPTGTTSGGDVLFCEVDRTGRWLLLPPIHRGRISARNGDLKGEIIVMIRGFHSDGTEWNEVFSLRSEDEQAGFEWVQMLGLQPIPPQLAEIKQDASILKMPRPTSSHASSSVVSAATGSTSPQKSRTPSPHEIEVPIGEQANPASKKWKSETPDRHRKSRSISPITPPESDISSADQRLASSPVSPPSPASNQHRVDNGHRARTPRRTGHDAEDATEYNTPRNLNEAMMMAGDGSPTPLKRTKAKRLSKNPPQAPSAAQSSRQIVLDDLQEETKTPRKLSKRNRSEQPPPPSASSVSHSSKGFSVWMPTSETEYSDESDEDVKPVASNKRPQTHRRTSSVPSMDLPSIPKVRRTSQPTTPIKDPLESVDAQKPPASAPSKLQKKAPKTDVETRRKEEDDKPPPVPPHRSSSPATPSTLKTSNTPVFTPKLHPHKTKRRSSSPLKHEYEPSTATESSSDSEGELSANEHESCTSESSEDELEDDVPMPLMPVGQITKFPRVSPPSSIYTLPNGTISPSQSASNSPYRAVPQTSTKVSKAIASIFSWSDAGRWDSLHPGDCSIIVTPGKLEVYELTAAHSKPLMADGDEIIMPEGKPPLVAVELTPLVLLRKSTAIDISFRSPPTADSRIKCGNQIMLRSRNPAECSELYAMINYSRINNPTYIALQNARGPYGQTSWAEVMDRQNAARSNEGSSGGWFTGTLGRRSSYRKTSTRAASISAATESSVGTMSTAFRSALGRFNFGRNSRFNIRNSTLGSRSDNSFDTGSSGSGTSTPPNLEPGRAPGAPAGITNTKCRLYERDTFSSRWRDMGAARLTIMLPDPSTPRNTTRQGKGSPGMRDPMQEKRIVIVGKTKGETLLDATLGESCFERVARLGIAVSVWEDIVGPSGLVGTVGAIGGVSGAKARVFMIQMKSERECAYSFSLLGKLRY